MLPVCRTRVKSEGDKGAVIEIERGCVIDKTDMGCFYKDLGGGKKETVRKCDDHNNCNTLTWENGKLGMLECKAKSGASSSVIQEGIFILIAASTTAIMMNI